MNFPDNAANRFGSAAFAERDDLRAAGMLQQRPESLFIGFISGKPLWYDGPGGLLLTAGARAGKLKDILAYNICAGVHRGPMLILDMKGELAAISQDQTPDQKACIYWNPANLHGLPQHRINPLDFIRIDSPSLVSDTKVFCENMVPPTGSANAVYFERRGQMYLEAFALLASELDGVLTLPRLYQIVNLVPGGGEAWLDFAFEMSRSRFPLVRQVEEEIAAARTDPGNGFQGIMGEIYKALAPLSDPQLMASVSPPFDFSLEDFCTGDQAHQVYLMPPAEFVESWAPVIKALLVAGMIYKARAPQAPRQTWIIDECAQLGAFPLVVKLFTYGAGIGIRPWAIFQSTHQMNALGSGAETIITSSAALRSYFAVRDIASATAVSRMLGAQTLAFDDQHRQAGARHSKREALHALLGGEDPLSAGLRYARHKEMAQMESKQHRHLMTPDEVLNMPGDRQLIFVDGLSSPIWAERAAYFEQRWMAGRYHPNPYHPPADRVRVKTWRGHAWRRVVREPVSARFARYPQYAGGTWSRIEE